MRHGRWGACLGARRVRPQGECDMRMPQVSERIKEAPAQALRGVFAGIGQLLLITDKLRNKAPGHDEAQQAAPPEPPRAEETAAAPAAEAEPVAGAEPAAGAEPGAAEAQGDPGETGRGAVPH